MAYFTACMAFFWIWLYLLGPARGWNIFIFETSSGAFLPCGDLFVPRWVVLSRLSNEDSSELLAVTSFPRGFNTAEAVPPPAFY